jgi:hypothetical protein
MEVTLDKLHVAAVVQLVPEGYCFIGKTTVGERNNEWGTDLQHAPDLSQHLDRPG